MVSAAKYILKPIGILLFLGLALFTYLFIMPFYITEVPTCVRYEFSRDLTSSSIIRIDEVMRELNLTILESNSTRTWESDYSKAYLENGGDNFYTYLSICTKAQSSKQWHMIAKKIEKLELNGITKINIQLDKGTYDCEPYCIREVKKLPDYSELKTQQN